MDKHTLSNYGFVLVATIIVAALLAVLSPLTPFGDFVRSSINEVVDNYMEKTDIEDVENKTDNVNPIPNGDNVLRKVTINLLYEDGKQIQAPIIINVNHGEKANLKSKIPTIDGYTVINMPKEEAIVKDTEYNIIFSKNSYSITYETNGGTIVSAKPTSYMYSDIVELPTKVVKEGMYFAGWYLNSDFSGNRIYKIDSNIKGDVTFYARWEKNAFNVKYISNGKELTFDEQFMRVFYGESIVLPVMEAQNGYNFGGWYTNQYFSGNNVTQTPQYPEKDLVYYAMWSSEGYSISYETNGGTFTGAVIRTYATGQKVVLPTCIEKTGYTFGGWYTESGLTNKKTEIGKNEYGNKVFYAKWIPATYKITYDLAGGSASGTLTSTYTYNPNSSPLTYNQSVSKPGYTFTGWFDVDLGTIETSIAKGRHGDITLVAQYTTKAYEITYNANGGTPTSTTVAIRYNSEYGVGPTVTRIGYDFDGWYTAASGGTKITSTTKFTRTSNQTLYAHWKTAVYNVEYVTNGGTFGSTPTSQYTYGTGLTLPTNITKANYTFAGWYTDAALTKSITKISTTSYGKVVVYAKWNPNVYSITFNANGGSLSSTPPSKYTYGVGINPLPIPTKTGYNFIGWKNASGKMVDVISTTDSGNQTLTAQWTAKQLTVDIVLTNSSGNVLLNSSNQAYKITVTPTYGTKYSYSDSEIVNTFNLQNSYYHLPFDFTYTEQNAIDNNFNITIKVKCYTYRTLNVELYYDNVKQLLDSNSSASNFKPKYVFRQSTHETATLTIPQYLDNQAYILDNNGLGGKTVEAYLGNSSSKTLKIYYKAYKFAVNFVYDSTMIPTATLPTEYCYGNIPFTVPVFTKDCYEFDGYTIVNGTASGSGNTRSITPSQPGEVTLTPKFKLDPDPEDHTMGSLVTTTPYCNKTGIRTYTCSDKCGFSYTEVEPKDPDNHANTTSFDWGGTKDIHQKYKCCGAVYSRNHSCTESITTPAKCGVKGVKTHTCACGYKYTSEIAALTHSYTEETASSTYLKSAATCTAAAVYYKNCSRSGCTAKGTATFTYGSALNHSWGGWGTGDATNHTRSCTRSGCSATNSAAHSMSKTGTSSVCKTCSVCSRQDTSHNMVAGSTSYYFKFNDYCYNTKTPSTCSKCSYSTTTNGNGRGYHNKYNGYDNKYFWTSSRVQSMSVNGTSRNVFKYWYKAKPDGTSTTSTSWFSPNVNRVGPSNGYGIGAWAGNNDYGATFTTASGYNGSGSSYETNQGESMSYSSSYGFWQCSTDYTIGSTKYYCRCPWGAIAG